MSAIGETTQAINIFFCYAHEDEPIRNELEKHLRILKRQGHIMLWHDREISAGIEWESEISMRLNTAQIILLLISPDFMDSDYCYGIEMEQAIKRHNAGEACVLPIILRPVHWEDAPFSKFQVLPTDGKPITRWLDRDEAFLDVAREIRKIVKAQKEITLQVLSKLKEEIEQEEIAQEERVLSQMQEKKEFLNAQKGDILQFSYVRLNVRTQSVYCNDQILDLTSKEYKLLEFFFRHPEQVLERGMILDRIWGNDSEVISNVLDAKVSHLREKLEGYGKRIIHTKRGVGYILKEI